MGPNLTPNPGATPNPTPGTFPLPSPSLAEGLSRLSDPLAGLGEGSGEGLGEGEGEGLGEGEGSGSRVTFAGIGRLEMVEQIRPGQPDEPRVIHVLSTQEQDTLSANCQHTPNTRKTTNQTNKQTPTLSPSRTPCCGP